MEGVAQFLAAVTIRFIGEGQHGPEIRSR
jgi:hypothetical protein